VRMTTPLRTIARSRQEWVSLGEQMKVYEPS
jgi:hypothetical protein